ncbi:nuclear transport factor 2 family protein [Xenophilus sp.]|uniref:nuclear transport factor 2 family protein n=1 Tax=Xenophilus sp. TaxID=1873499 RepID=UPI0037DBF8FE
MPAALGGPQCDQAERACIRLCVDFANHIDARRYPELLDLFTPGGTLDRMGMVFQGRKQIARFLASRPDAIVTRHLCTNFRIAVEGDADARGVCYALFFQAAASSGVPTMTGLPAIVEYHDRFKRTPDGWRIDERRILPAMQPDHS